ncbi:MAG: STAS/SEC14 domain-containing protein [Desulfobulbaceae bacterium]|nr:STAS/SEC14 domain-containing protein [Desulfobulbaceae bacterium]
MIIELPESADKTLGFEITGKVTIEEEKEWIQKIEDSLRTHEKLNILVVLNEGASWGINAGIEDIKWIMTHMKSIHKIAIVSSSSVWKWLVSLDSFFASMVGIEERHFAHSDLPDAWEWIRN